MQSVFFRVTGDGHRGIGFSGASRSAFGSRLRVPAAVTRHLKMSNRYPLLPTLHTRAGYRTWRRNSRARTGRKDCHRL